MINLKKPWEGMLEPVKKWENLWFVGGYPASVHIVETGEGLILFDCGYQESLYLVLDGMRRLGLNPERISDIFITHGHIDHCGAAVALRQLYGCKLWISETDAPAVEGTAETDLTYATEFDMPFLFFTPDGLLHDGDCITCGNVTVTARKTPGHTAGALSYFFDLTDGTRTLRAGLHGGAGVNSLTKAYLSVHNLPFSLREDFVRSMQELKQEKVDIFLGNHAKQDATEAKTERQKAGEKDVFVNPAEWEAFLEQSVQNLEKLIRKESAGANA